MARVWTWGQKDLVYDFQPLSLLSDLPTVSFGPFMYTLGALRRGADLAQG